MRITIGAKTYKATLEDNPTVAKLRLLLPLTLKMTELSGNEKYHHLSTRLPTDANRATHLIDGSESMEAYVFLKTLFIKED